ncbi:MAG: hypothetical protein KDE56_08530, partial [Anaerolineales bacterium]|nr:hypothetical protein [Anaerolineales bacterium]
IVAESLDYVATRLENAKGDFNEAVQLLLKEIITEHGSIIFDGDGYSDAWHKEAEFKRGLPNLRTTFDALPALVSEDAVELFTKYGVMSERETESRYEVYMEQYVKSVTVEAKLTAEIAKTLIYPAAVRYQGELAGAAANLKAVGIAPDMGVLNEVTTAVTGLQQSVARLEKLIAHEGHDLPSEAKHMRDALLPAMLDVRGYADELEGLVADDLWPLPTYQEMLFIK